MDKEIIEEKQNTPDLSQLMADGRPVFGGTTPNAGDAEPAKPALPGPDAAEKAVAAEKEKTAAAEKETAEAAEAEKAATAEAEKTAAAEKEKEAGKGAGKEGEDDAALKKKDDTHPELTPRFKSHEEAEKGYREVQGKATKAEKRASELEKENLALKTERDREKTEKEQKESLAASRTKVLEFGKTRKKQALEAIDALDPDDPEYRSLAAELLTQADIDILENYRQNQPAQAADTPAKGKPAVEETAATTAKAGDSPEAAALLEHTLGRVKNAGIANDDELFWLFAGQTPATDSEGKRLDLDRQIDWALERTKTYSSKQEAKIKESIEKAAGERGRKNQEEGLPLGRGGNPAGPGTTETGKEKPAEEQKPFGLNDAMDFALNSRRLD